MLKDIRRKVMQIANRLVGQGYIRANAMATAWKLVRYRALKAKVSGTSFDNRSVTRLDIFMRKLFYSMAAGRAVNKQLLQNEQRIVLCGHAPALMDKGISVHADTLQLLAA